MKHETLDNRKKWTARYCLLGPVAIWLSLSGCADSPYRIVRFDDPSELSEVSTANLCNAFVYHWGPYGVGLSMEHRTEIKDRLIAELRSRDVFSIDEWYAIAHGRLFFGMSESAARCARFPTGLTQVVYRKTGPWGERKVVKWLFDTDEAIYFENGKVVGYEDNGSKLSGRFDYESLDSTLRTPALLLRPEDIADHVLVRGDRIVVKFLNGTENSISVAESGSGQIMDVDGRSYALDEIKFVALISVEDPESGRLSYDWSKWFEGEWPDFRF